MKFAVIIALLPFVSTAPVRMQKRIAQVIAESTAEWEAACIAAGGAGQCNPISQTAFTSLLAAGGNCDQQDAADAMIDLAKSLSATPDAEMVRLAQLFVQQPRNAPDSLQVPYCQVEPKNAELTGLFHCQFEGSDFTAFSGDQTGNIPLGLAAVDPAGSCPAKTDGPVPDGVQLNTLVDDPGVGAVADDGANNAEGGVAAGADETPDDTAAVPVPDASTSSDFALQNGLDAIAQNTEFDSLSATSSCTDGTQACVDGAFAQCVGGTFALTQCAGGTQCFALPLVNSPGTSITCSTAADKDARIAATGATSGADGANNASGDIAAGADETIDTTVEDTTPPIVASTGFALQNGLDAIAQNAEFDALSATSSCTDGTQACVDGAFAQCVGGTFALTQCAGGTQCFALPLVNSPGTSITCSTAADKDARIAATGAQ